MPGSPRDCAFDFGVPIDRLVPLLTEQPRFVLAVRAWSEGVRAEAAAARYDLPWIDPDGLDWERLLA